MDRCGDRVQLSHSPTSPVTVHAHWVAAILCQLWQAMEGGILGEHMKGCRVCCPFFKEAEQNLQCATVAPPGQHHGCSSLLAGSGVVCVSPWSPHPHPHSHLNALACANGCKAHVTFL